MTGKYIDAIVLEDALDGSGGLASSIITSLAALSAPVIIDAKTVNYLRVESMMEVRF